MTTTDLNTDMLLRLRDAVQDGHMHLAQALAALVWGPTPAADETHMIDPAAVLDELRWLAARVWLAHQSGAADDELATDAAHVLARLLPDDDRDEYSNGAAVWNVHLLDGIETNRHLNDPPHRRGRTA